MDEKKLGKEYIETMLDKSSADGKKDKAETLAKALEYALEARKLEISLYWTKAKFFWLFIAALFVAYFMLQGMGVAFSFVITIGGYIFAFCWYLSGRDSIFWQKNWDMHIDFLEDNVIGSLYKTVENPYRYKWYRLLDGYASSSSKINQLLSLIIVLVWAYLVGQTFFLVVNLFQAIVFAALTVIVLSVIIFALTDSGLSRKDKGSPRITRSLKGHK